MMLSRWVFVLVGVVVAGYGVFHFILARQARAERRQAAAGGDREGRDGSRSGSPVSHVVRGILFLILGAWLMLTGLGWLGRLQPPNVPGRSASAGRGVAGGQCTAGPTCAG